MKKFVGITLLLFVAGLLYVVFYTNYPSIFAAGKKLNPWDQQKDGSCKRGALCKGLVSQETANARTDVHPAGTEGNRTDYRDANGNFVFAVQNPKKEREKEVAIAPTATPTPTPNPTATPTPTPTPTPGPTATPTPTPTPAPPQVVYVRQVPRQLPPTGFPTDAVAAGALASGSLGWMIIRRFRA